MITLEQVRLLEEKVESAVLKIAALTAENADLRRTLTEISMQNSEFAKKNANLMELLSKNEENQERIEKGILNALYRLNDIESAVLSPTGATQEVAETVVTEQNNFNNLTQNHPVTEQQSDIEIPNTDSDFETDENFELEQDESPESFEDNDNKSTIPSEQQANTSDEHIDIF